MNKDRLRELIRDVARGEHALELLYRELSPKGAQASLEPELIKTLDAETLLDEKPLQPKVQAEAERLAAVRVPQQVVVTKASKFHPVAGGIPGRLLAAWQASDKKDQALGIERLRKFVPGAKRRSFIATLSQLSIEGQLERVAPGIYRLVRK